MMGIIVKVNKIFIKNISLNLTLLVGLGSAPHLDCFHPDDCSNGHLVLIDQSIVCLAICLTKAGSDHPLLA